MSSYCVVISTFANEVDAKNVLKELVENRLVACAQIMPINSIYLWECELCDDNEALVLMKTKKNLFNELKETIEKLHPYDVPEIICLDISDGNSSYLNWIETETK